MEVFGTWPLDGSSRNFSITIGGVQAGATEVFVRNVPIMLSGGVPLEVMPGASSIFITHLTDKSNVLPASVVMFDPQINLDPSQAFVHLNGQPVTAASPAAPGEVVTTHMFGLGLTAPPTPTGTTVTSFVPLANLPTVTVGGQPVELRFAGLAPGDRSSGFYPVSFTLPPDAPPGPRPVVIATGGVNSNTQTLFAGSSPLPSPPVISKVVNGASFGGLFTAPGSFVSIFASGLGNVDNLSAFPATTVNGISVFINGKPAPIFHLIASAGQINALVPNDSDTGPNGLSVVVQNSNGPSKSGAASGLAAAPGIFLVADPSNATRKNAAATFPNTAWLVVPASQARALGIGACAGVSPAALCGQPARAGDFVQLYVTGLGKATPGGEPSGAVLPTGQNPPANGNPLYATVVVPTVTVGGLPAKVIFSGLAPGFSGLYQVDLQIPVGVPAGDNVPIQMISGTESDSATLAIAP